MKEQPALQFPLFGRGSEGEEIEIVRVLQDLFGELRVSRWQSAREIGEGFALPLMQPALNLMNQDIAAPAKFERGFEIPLAGGCIFHPVQKNHRLNSNKGAERLLSQTTY